MHNQPCLVNSGTTIADPGTTNDGFVGRGRNIYIIAATANFTANGVAVVIGTAGGVNFGNNPLQVNGAVTSATTGTIFYYIA